MISRLLGCVDCEAHRGRSRRRRSPRWSTPRRPQARRRRDLRTPTCRCRSPWIAQLAPLGEPRPLDADIATDVAIIGAGIAGIATAFFTLRSTGQRVLVLERDRVAHGATGRNAGQLTTYFERPLHDIAAQFGDGLAIEGQRAFDDAHDLLDLLVAETGATVRVERFTGHMGMFTLNHVLVHLRNNRLRLHGGLRIEPCVVSEEAAFLHEIPAEFAELYTVVPQAHIRELLETDDDRYRAVLSDRKGCANSALLCQQVLAYLEQHYPDRLRFADRTEVERVVVGSGGVEVHANGHRVCAARVVLCTNGYTRHVVEDDAGRRSCSTRSSRSSARTASWRRSPRSSRARPLR